MCSSDAPDYTPVANASKEAAQSAERAAAADLAFREKVYEENKPLIATAQQIGLSNAAKQGQIADQNIERGNQLLAEDKVYGQKARAKMYADADTIGGAEDQDRAAGRAVADVRQQSALNQSSLERNLAAMGINPNSSKFVSLKRSVALSDAAGAAGAATNARETQRDKGVALRAGAANFSEGMGNSAATTYGTALNAGNSAEGNANNSANASLPNANMVGEGYKSGLQASQIGMQHASNLANIATGTYNAENQDSGLFTGLGNLAMGAGAMGVKFSDARLKENIEPAGEENGHKLYSFNYIDGHGLPKGRFVGVLADEVKETNPEAVTLDDNGYMLVDYSKLGIEMRAAK